MDIYKIQALVEQCGDASRFFPTQIIESDIEIDLDLDDGIFYRHYPPSWGRVYTEEMRKEISQRNKQRGISFASNGATEAARIVNTGRKNSVDSIKKMSKAAFNRKKVKCSHCDVIGHPGNMKRWHFDNCKHR